MKDLCKHLKVKIGTANKAQLVGQLLSQWQLGLLEDEEEESEHHVSALTPTVKQRLAEMPPFESISTWTKDLSPLENFIFGDLFVYLIESKYKEFDKDSLRAFNSLKGYKYFEEGFVRNAWLHEIPDSDLLYVRSNCFSSLTVKQTYTVYVCLSKQGTVYSAKCQCKAGLGQACSHVAALIFKLESLKRNNISRIPEACLLGQGKRILSSWYIMPIQRINILENVDCAIENLSAIS